MIFIYIYIITLFDVLKYNSCCWNCRNKLE